MNIPSPDRSSGFGQRFTRRQALAAIGTGTTTALSGCMSVLQAEPRSLNPPELVKDGPTERVWNFPRGASDENTPIQAYLRQTYRVPKSQQSVGVLFKFGATVFEHTKYHHDQIILRLRAPASPQAGRSPADIFVEPVTGGFSLKTYKENQETVITLRDLNETGTLQFSFFVNPRTQPMPEALGYEFKIVAENSQMLGENVVVSDTGRFPITFENG